MARWCAVPYCKTGSRTEQIKRSLFGVPKDPIIWKKWEEAIPGIVKLRQTDVICDKHFEEKDISREWIKLDTNDQVIARSHTSIRNLKSKPCPRNSVTFRQEIVSRCMNMRSEYAMSLPNPLI